MRKRTACVTYRFCRINIVLMAAVCSIYWLLFGYFARWRRKKPCIKDWGICKCIFGSILSVSVSINFLHRCRIMQNEFKLPFVCPVQIQVTARRLPQKMFQALTFSSKLRNNVSSSLLSACYVLFTFDFLLFAMALVLNVNERKTWHTCRK